MHIAGLLTLSFEPGLWLPVLLAVLGKATLLLLFAKALVRALRGSAAATRHLIWSVAITGLLVLPGLEVLLPQWQLPVFPAFVRAAAADAPDAAAREARPDEAGKAQEAESDKVEFTRSASLKYSPSAKPARRKTFDELPLAPPYETPLLEDVRDQETVLTTPAAAKRSLNWAGLFLIVWAAGFLLVALRRLAGTFTLWRIAQGAQALTDAYWRGLTDEIALQLGLRKTIKLVRSKRVKVPMTWGIRRPVVLLPEEARYWSAACSRIVLLHELAHILRRDCLTQLLAQVAGALYWFHPMVWSAAKRLRLERELACDDQVLASGTRATDYASHLLEIASNYEAKLLASPMTAGMACSQLEQRLVAILDPQIKRLSLSRLRVICATFMALGLVLPLALVQPWVKAARLAPDDPLAARQAATPGSEIEKQADANPANGFKAQTQKLLARIEHQTDSQNPGPDSHNLPLALPVALPLHANPAGEAGVYAPKAAEAQTDKGQANFSSEPGRRLTQLGITPEFIEAARRMGFDNLTPNQLVQMRVHKIDKEFVGLARQWGLADLTLNQLVQLRVAGVNTEYVEALKQAGFANLSAGNLANLKLLNVTPDFIKEMRRNGLGKPTVERLLSLRVHNIDAAFIKEVEGWGFGKLTLDELLQVRVHKVTPAFAAQMRATGFDNLSLNHLVQLRLAGVNAEFINEMRHLGFSNLTPEQILQMRHQGIDAEYVRKLRAAGFKNISVRQMLDLKRDRIDEILLKNSH